MISKKRPEIILLGGPNGAGKSTFGETLFASSKGTRLFINPDAVTRSLSPQFDQNASLQAARLVLGAIHDRIESGEDFAFESTLAGLSWIPILKRASKQGYSIRIYFLFLKTFELHLSRITKRVELGGHNIPEAVVKRRYQRCFENFWREYRLLADHFIIVDNSNGKPVVQLSSEDLRSLKKVELEKIENFFLTPGLKKKWPL